MKKNLISASVLLVASAIFAFLATAEPARRIAETDITVEEPVPVDGCKLPPFERIGVECIGYNRGVVTIRLVSGELCAYEVADGWDKSCADRCPGLMDVMHNPGNNTVACVSYSGPG